jgi:thiamine biosynthesis lipoprotein ApbE
MGKLKWGIITIALVAVAGLFFNWMNREEEFSGKEFLFDTYCTVTVYGDDGEEAVAAVFERAEEIHNKTNAFSEKSEVYKINSAKDRDNHPPMSLLH